MAGDGVSTYLALTFGTLLSSQGTVASVVLTLSGFPPGFPSILRFRLYQIVFRSDFLGAFQVSAFAFPFPAVPTLSDPFGVRFPVGGLSRAFRLSPSGLSTFTTLTDSPRRLIIESLAFEFGHAGAPEIDPGEGL
ncbi:hypothetical protein KUM39_27605, partial [Streptomyces sp. J2-1]|uniref:hypothetical protein n=1 Tax=Streptomyces corallincola TaxID=2851888 RepID=UPI001C390E7A